MHAIQSFEIGIAILQFVSKCQHDEWRYVANFAYFAYFASKIGCLEGSQNEITGYQALPTPTNPENLAKISPVDPEIRGLEVDHSIRK